MRKKILLFIIIIFLIIPVFSSAQRPLEVDYPLTPEGERPFSVETTTFALYVRYIYNISFGIAGVVAFLALLYAGFLYLSSAGNSEKIKEAKKRILSSILGIVILLASYVLLVAINPETVMLITPRLETIPSSEYVPSIREFQSQKWGTIKEIGVMGGLAIQEIGDLGQDISESSLMCLCFNARGLCLCPGGEEGDVCEPETCYASEDSDGHPCSNYDEIMAWQKLMVFWFDELVYYQNRAVGTNLLRAAGLEEAEEGVIEAIVEGAAEGSFEGMLEGAFEIALFEFLGGEAKVLQKTIVDISNPTIAYYEEYIEGMPAETDPRTIQALNQLLNKEEEKLELKQNLIEELVEFSFLVEAIKGPVDQLAHLTEQCALNTQTQCQPQCIGECHDSFIGCQAVCMGLNPCPIIDIAFAWAAFELLEGEIEDSTEQITELVDELRQL